MKLSALSLICLLALASCKTPDIVLSSTLSNDVETDRVQSRGGKIPGRTFSYLEFTTSPIEKGWPQNYSDAFTQTFGVTKNKASRSVLHFRQYDSLMNEVLVLVLMHPDEEQLQWARQWFDADDVPPGSVLARIVSPDGSASDILIYGTPEGMIHEPGLLLGWMKEERSGDMEIRAADTQKAEGPVAVYNHAYVISKGEKNLAAVSTLYQGKVWLDRGLNTEYRLLCAGLISTLLIKNTIKEDYQMELDPVIARPMDKMFQVMERFPVR